MNEIKFISKIHKRLNPKIYRWKINDRYHGGIPDTFYSGPGGFCFVEYKYIPKIPKKQTTLLKFKLTEQQRAWLNKQASFGVPVYTAFAAGEHVLFTDSFTTCEFTVQEFKENAVSVQQFIDLLTIICLDNGQN